MAYTPHTWEIDEIITADKLNNLENGVAAVKDGIDGKDGATGAKGDTGAAGKDGATGPAGKDGLSVKSGELTTDADGKLTGGTLTMSDDSTVTLTVKSATA